MNWLRLQLEPQSKLGLGNLKRFLGLDVPKSVALCPIGIDLVLSVIGIGATNEAAIQLQRLGTVADMRKRLEQAQALPGTTYFILDKTATCSENLQLPVEFKQMNLKTVSAMDKINQLIEDHTGFSDLMTEESFNSDTWAFVINVLNFKAAWLKPFSVEATQLGKFTRGDRYVAMIPMMHSRRTILVSGKKAVRLEMKGAQATFILGLPGEALDPFEEQLCDLSLPKFEHVQDLDLKSLLSSAGFDAIFRKGNLGGFDPQVQISDVKQRISVCFDEAGAEVKAATVAEFVLKSIGPIEDAVTISFDRPFHYYITIGDMQIVAGYLG